MNRLRKLLGLATVHTATRDEAGRVIINPDEKTRLNVWG